MPVREYIEEELRQATIRSALPDEVVHTSPISLIPKGGQPGRFRLIVDLSSPQPELCSLSYSLVDEAVARVRWCRPGALMALKSAYRRSPCTRTTSRYSGCRGRAIPFATSSSFGLSSAPKLFTAVADGKGVANSLHYLDFGWRQALRLRTGLVYGRANMLQARAPGGSDCNCVPRNSGRLCPPGGHAP